MKSTIYDHLERKRKTKPHDYLGEKPKSLKSTISPRNVIDDNGKPLKSTNRSYLKSQKISNSDYLRRSGRTDWELDSYLPVEAVENLVEEPLSKHFDKTSPYHAAAVAAAVQSEEAKEAGSLDDNTATRQVVPILGAAPGAGPVGVVNQVPLVNQLPFLNNGVSSRITQKGCL